MTGVISKAEHPDEPATTLTALRTNLANIQNTYAALNVSTYVPAYYFILRAHSSDCLSV